MNAALRESFHFHLEHGGYCTPPGRAACALASARAELAAKENDDLRIRWVDDSDYIDLSWDENGQTLRGLESGEFICEGCIVEQRCPTCGQWEHLESLWQIISEPGSAYHRVVEAELLPEPQP